MVYIKKYKKTLYKIKYTIFCIIYVYIYTYIPWIIISMGFPGGSDGKQFACILILYTFN